MLQKVAGQQAGLSGSIQRRRTDQTTGVLEDRGCTLAISRVQPERSRLVGRGWGRCAPRCCVLTVHPHYAIVLPAILAVGHLFPPNLVPFHPCALPAHLKHRAAEVVGAAPKESKQRGRWCKEQEGGRAYTGSCNNRNRPRNPYLLAMPTVPLYSTRARTSNIQKGSSVARKRHGPPGGSRLLGATCTAPLCHDRNLRRASASSISNGTTWGGRPS